MTLADITAEEFSALKVLHLERDKHQEEQNRAAMQEAQRPKVRMSSFD